MTCEPRNDPGQDFLGLGFPAGRRRAQGGPVRPRRDMDDLVAALFEGAQKLRQHLRRRHAAIVQRQNPAPGVIEPLENEIELGLRGQQQPV